MNESARSKNQGSRLPNFGSSATVTMPHFIVD